MTSKTDKKNLEDLLYKVCPQCFTETSDSKTVSLDKLEKWLNELTAEKYEFTWPGKQEAIAMAEAPAESTLYPCVEESVDWDTTKNLYIEGDNLEVLKLLQNSYAGKVKMIYIDPPYNTGHKLAYNDKFVLSAKAYKAKYGENANLEGRFHTEWLNMIYPRLKVARDLLTEDGVIFISIDNNEVGNLKKVCDEIFGEFSFVTVIHVQMSTAQGQKVRAAKAGNIVKNAEYILVYSKNGNKTIGKNHFLILLDMIITITNFCYQIVTVHIQKQC